MKNPSYLCNTNYCLLKYALHIYHCLSSAIRALHIFHCLSLAIWGINISPSYPLVDQPFNITCDMSGGTAQGILFQNWKSGQLKEYSIMSNRGCIQSKYCFVSNSILTLYFSGPTYHESLDHTYWRCADVRSFSTGSTFKLLSFYGTFYWY